MSEDWFPVLWGYRAAEEMKACAKGSPFVVIAIPWAMIGPHERQAVRNHSQTLKRLAERGGLSPGEAIAVLDDRHWSNVPIARANADLVLRIQTFLAQTTGSAP